MTEQFRVTREESGFHLESPAELTLAAFLEAFEEMGRLDPERTCVYAIFDMSSIRSYGLSVEEHHAIMVGSQTRFPADKDFRAAFVRHSPEFDDVLGSFETAQTLIGGRPPGQYASLQAFGSEEEARRWAVPRREAATRD